MEKVKPKKSLGQNFLRDDAVIEKIIGTFAAQPDDYVLEIGPGMGALTEHLLGKCKHLTLVEYDERAVDYLKERFPEEKYNDLSLHHQDFREYDIGTALNGIKGAGKNKLKVIGNIPYNISSDILFHLIENREHIEKAQLMVQKEVALRLVSPPSKKVYGITTIAVNMVGTCDRIFDVPPECFHPQPKVTSSIIELRFNKQINEELFQKTMGIVKAAFNQRRKQLRNSLKNYFQTNLSEKSVDFVSYLDDEKSFLLSKRPENLSYIEFMELNDEIMNFK